MEAWVIACIVFVFAALMEYTGILLQVLDDADDDICLVGGHSPPQKPVVPSSHALRPATRIRVLGAAKGVRRPLLKST